MEGKIQKLLVASSLLMGAAVALIPLTSYATDGPYPTNGDKYAPGYECNKQGTCAHGEGSTVVYVNVDDILSLDAVAFSGTNGDTAIQVMPNMPREGSLQATVRSAKPYTISLSAENPYLVNQADDIYVIPSRANVSNDSTAWGIKKIGETLNPDDVYSAITTNPEVFFEGGPHDESTTTEFPVGVSVTANVPQGTYATDVTVTAAVKE